MHVTAGHDPPAVLPALIEWGNSFAPLINCVQASLEMEVHDQGNSGEGAANPLTTLHVVPLEMPMECVGLECR